MRLIALNRFRGVAPEIEPRLLPAPLAQRAVNCRTWGGSLNPWKQAAEVATPTKVGTVRTIFRMDNEAGGPSTWLNFLEDVDIARGFVDDGSQEIIWTGQAEPRISNFALATSGVDFPDQWYVLGTPAPLSAPTVSSVSGGSTSGTRVYVYTFVALLGNRALEGPPSPTVSHTGNTVGATWNLTVPENTLNNTGACTAVSSSAGQTIYTVASNKYLRVGEEVTFAGLSDASVNGTFAVIEIISTNQVKCQTGSSFTDASEAGTWTRVSPHNVTGMVKRIYRQDALGAYRFVADVPLATTTYADTLSDTDLTQRSRLESTNYDMPPVGLKGLREIGGLMMAGFFGSTLCISEPGKPHAWPTSYRQNIAFKIVGLGAYEQTVVIGTQGPPYIATGTVPTTMVPMKLDLKWPCLSKRGIVSLQSGVLYSTAQGIAYIGSGGARLATGGIVTKDSFQAFHPEDITAARYEDRYFGFWDVGSFDRGGFILDVADGQPDLGPLNYAPSAAWTDPEDGKLYLVLDGIICEWNAHATDYLVAEWLSPPAPQPRPVNPGAARVSFAMADIADAAADAARIQWFYDYNTALLALTEPPYPGDPVFGGPLGGSMLGEFVFGGSDLYEDLSPDSVRSCQFVLYVDGVLRHTQDIVNEEPFTLPSGYDGREVAVGAITTVKVKAIELGESVDDLQEMAP